MKNKYILMLAFALVALMPASLLAATPADDDANFRAVAGAMIEHGELRKAAKYLNSLPKKIRTSQAFAIDSLLKLADRVRDDFSLSPAEGRKQIEKRMGPVTDEKLTYWKKQRYIEADTIDGREMWFHRAVGNFFLLNHEDFKESQDEDRKSTNQYYAKLYNQAAASPAYGNHLRFPHRWQLTFNITVRPDAIPDGDTLRVWMPFPTETERQSDIRLLSSSAQAYISRNSPQHTVYMEGVAHKGQPSKFSITFSYISAEQHFTRAEIMAALKPYDTSSALYQQYTADEYPHIVKTPHLMALARQLVGSEKNPVMQASIVYDWIVTNFPWAGAREYSTIPNIPEYVIANRHGDCGQVSLLYITLMRCLGIPARWESGWMLHPGAKNYHDWAETYFEGVGWVPTDASFGRSTAGESMADYYKTGLDVYRFAANKAVNAQFDPAKRYIRSETVDNQAGEVEWKGGNLEYSDFDSELVIDSCVALDYFHPSKPWALTKLSVASMRSSAAHSAEMLTQSVMGTPLRLTAAADDWYEAETPEGYKSWIPAGSVTLLDSAALTAWKHSKRYIVTAYQSVLTSKAGSDEAVSDLVMGDILSYVSASGRYVCLATPDGRRGYVNAADVEGLSSWAARPATAERVLATARRMMGSPYFWGGTSTKMTDCSGLSKVSYLSAGVILRRDAWQQALTGERIDAKEWAGARPGDLFFFGTRGGRVTHVAISLGGGKFIHCSGRVRINSVDPKAKDYLNVPFLSISRILGSEGTDGITRVKDHPWYF